MSELYKKLENGVPTGGLFIESNLRDLFLDELPRTGYITVEAAASIGYAKFQVTPIPTNDNFLKEYVEDAPVEGSDGVWSQSWKLVDIEFSTPEDRQLALEKTNQKKLQSKLDELSVVFSKKSERPRVPTTLGFDVDGSYNDLQNFMIGKDLELTEVKDADNKLHPVNLSDYDLIFQAIKIRGALIIQTKWQVESSLKSVDLTSEDAISALDAIDVNDAFKDFK